VALQPRTSIAESASQRRSQLDTYSSNSIIPQTQNLIGLTPSIAHPPGRDQTLLLPGRRRRALNKRGHHQRRALLKRRKGRHLTRRRGQLPRLKSKNAVRVSREGEIQNKHLK
jgi:hypothetical protein